MTENEIERITGGDPEGVDGTSDGNPIAGVEIDQEDLEHAVEPDDAAQEVDGPAQSHP